MGVFFGVCASPDFGSGIATPAKIKIRCIDAFNHGKSKYENSQPRPSSIRKMLGFHNPAETAEHQ